MNPIEAGEVRDRQDQFKGVGVSMNDPFEQFRKNKSQGFINRMKARDDGMMTVPSHMSCHTTTTK